MEAIDLYHFPMSAPSRAVLLLARFMGLMVNIKTINVMTGEQMAPDFLKMNPMHTVPTINDNGFYLWESRAIMEYLVDQYGKDDSLAPKDPRKAAILNQQLYFDSNSLAARMRAYFVPVMLQGVKPRDEDLAKLDEALKVFDAFLANNKWAAGDHITIADFSIVPTISTLESFKLDLSKYPNVVNWLSECKKVMVDYDEVNQQGADAFGQAFLSKLQ